MTLGKSGRRRLIAFLGGLGLLTAALFSTSGGSDDRSQPGQRRIAGLSDAVYSKQARPYVVSPDLTAKMTGMTKGGERWLSLASSW
jgi:hypothetical protein